MSARFDLSGLDIELNTPRCTVRVLKHSDVSESYVEWLNDPETSEFLESRFTPQTLRSISLFVDSHLKSANSILFGIFYGNEEKHVGNIKVEAQVRHLTAEIGFLIGDKNYRGFGLATEAVLTVSNWAFDSLGLAKLTAGCYSKNLGSFRTLVKAGFSREAILDSQVIDKSGQREAVFRFARQNSQ